MSARHNFYQHEMRHVKLPFVPGRTQTSLMALRQRVVYEELCTWPAHPGSPFLTTLHARFRTWAACVEEQRSLQRPSTALSVLHQLRQLQHPHQLPTLLQTLHRGGCPALFSVQYDPDLRQPEQTLLYFRVGEPLLGPQSRWTQSYVAALFQAFDQPAPTTDLRATEAQLFARRPASYELQSTACFNPVPEADWHHDLAWLKFYTLPEKVAVVSLDAVAFFQDLGHCARHMPWPAWRDYLTFCWLHKIADFYADTYTLAYRFTTDPVEPDTAAICQAETAVAAWWQDAGHQFVQHHRSALDQARSGVQALVSDMRDVLRAIIQHTAWEPSTRQEAWRKLDHMLVLIGGPDGDGPWVGRPPPPLPADLTFDDGLFWGYQYQYTQLWRHAGTVTDRRQWRWESSTVVNAFYSREANVVYLPAALLFPPFWSLEPDQRLANYCAMGCIVAHEMLHAFDYDSRHIDGSGRLRDWWAPADEHRFMQAVQRTLALYDRHQAGSSRLTLSENMADLSGLRLVWQTFLLRWQFSLDRPPTDTEARTFFHLYVVSQAQRYRPHAQRLARTTDLHAWAETRINVPLSTFVPFLTLYGVRRTDPMYTPVADRPDFWPLRRQG